MPACTRTGRDKDEESAAWSAVEARSMSAHTYKGTSSSFFKENKHLIPLPIANAGDIVGSHRSINTIAVGLNCGFGNFENPGATKYDLLVSWYQDLCFLTALRCLPIVFTCANDYADLLGECRLHCDYFGSYFWCQPGRSTFNCASTFVASEGAAATGATGAQGQDYSCGNSYWYIVQGCDPTRRRKFANGSARLPINCSTPLQERYAFMHALMGPQRQSAPAAPIEQCMLGSDVRAELPKWQYLGTFTEKAGGEETEAEKMAKAGSNEITEAQKTGGFPHVQGGDEVVPPLPPLSSVERQIEAESLATEQEQEQVEEHDQMLAGLALQSNVSGATAAPAIKQVLVDGGVLSVTCTFPIGYRGWEGVGVGVGASSIEMRSISALVDTDGKNLLLEGGAVDLAMTVPLLQAIQPATVRAKVSTKHRRITVTASIAK